MRVRWIVRMHDLSLPHSCAAIRRMGVLQVDTVHVVARSPYLVPWSRLRAYDPAWLDAIAPALPAEPT